MTESNDKKIYFPILLSMSDRKCLIIGGGPIARHKIQSLEKFTSNITILSPVVEETLKEMAEKNGYEILPKEYETADLNGFDIVIAATGKKALSKKIWNDCKERKLLINAVDDPEHCDFILPSTIKRGDLTVSIGTQGKSPFMTKEIRRWMNRMFTPEWGEVVDLAADYRRQVFAKYSPKQRKERDQCFARFVEIDWAAMLREKSPEELKDLLNSVLEGKKMTLENAEDSEKSS